MGGGESEGRGGRKNAEQLGLGGSGQHLDILPNVLVSGCGEAEGKVAGEGGV